jgi:hypothetical protein
MKTSRLTQYRAQLLRFETYFVNIDAGFLVAPHVLSFTTSPLMKLEASFL